MIIWVNPDNRWFRQVPQVVLHGQNSLHVFSAYQRALVLEVGPGRIDADTLNAYINLTIIWDSDIRNEWYIHAALHHGAGNRIKDKQALSGSPYKQIVSVEGQSGNGPRNTDMVSGFRLDAHKVVLLLIIYKETVIRADVHSIAQHANSPDAFAFPEQMEPGTVIPVQTIVGPEPHEAMAVFVNTEDVASRENIPGIKPCCDMIGKPGRRDLRHKSDDKAKNLLHGNTNIETFF